MSVGFLHHFLPTRRVRIAISIGSAAKYGMYYTQCFAVSDVYQGYNVVVSHRVK